VPNAFRALGLWMEPVWLLLGTRLRHCLIDPFGFSWLVAVSLRRPPIMRVGFPWISLDFLVRIETYQWVARHEARTIFIAPFRAVSSAGTVAGPVVRWLRNGRIVHGASLTKFLIRCNRLSSEPLPSAALNPKVTRSRGDLAPAPFHFPSKAGKRRRGPRSNRRALSFRTLDA
jgi:hypothetical protein